MSLVNSEEISLLLAEDIVNYFTTRINKLLETSHAKTLRRIADIISHQHDMLFAGLLKKFHIISNGIDILNLEVIAQEIFSDKITWGRLATWYTFGGRLAQYCMDCGLEEKHIKMISHTIGHHVSENVSSWLIRQGGWVSANY